MNKENYNELFSFESELPDNGKIQLPAEEIDKLKFAGVENILITVSINSKLSAIKNGIDPDLFDKIQSVQSIPSEVVAEFFAGKGSLGKSDFSERAVY